MVGDRGGFGHPGIHDDDRPGVVILHPVELIAGLGEAVALPGVLPDEHCAVGVLEVRHCPEILAAEQVSLYPTHAGLFLCQSITAVLHAQGLRHTAGVGTG